MLTRTMLSLALLMGGVAGAAHALSLAEAMEEAERQSPELQSLAAAVAAAEAAEGASGRLPAPRLAVGVDNLPVSGSQRFDLSADAMTMRTAGLMQEIPNGAARRASSERAVAATEIARARLQLRRRELRRDVALAWYACDYAQRRLTLLDELRREGVTQEEAALARLAAADTGAAEVLLARQALARLEDRRDELHIERARAMAELRRFIGDVDAQPSEEPDLPPVDAARLRAGVDRHPGLLMYVPMTRMAQAELGEARAERRPDWGVSLMYGDRAARFGDMVSMQVSVELPFATRARTSADIASRLQSVRQIAAEREAAARQRMAELEEGLAEHQAILAQLERVQQVHLPLARQQVEVRLAAYRAGTADLAALVMARQEEIEQRLRQLELHGRREMAAVPLVLMFGEAQP